MLEEQSVISQVTESWRKCAVIFYCTKLADEIYIKYVSDSFKRSF